jgi:predicted dehydrogenase
MKPEFPKLSAMKTSFVTLTRRDFLQRTGLAAASVGLMGLSARSRAAVPGANDRVRVGVVGFSDRFRSTLLPCFKDHNQELNFDIVAVSDLWSVRRDEGQKVLEKAMGHPIIACRNNDELYEKIKDLDAVIISTADFQHAMHTVDAVNAGKDTYTEKPLAETMADARAVLKAVRDNKRIVQIGSQRRSGPNYQAAADFIQSGKFGQIVSAEMTWNVNQPGRWRRPDLVAKCKEEDTDWNRYQLNRPKAAWDPRKYLEYRLFWPYSSGIPGQWMCHQIDTIHWFAKLPHPRSVVANGGIYLWNDGRTNADTLTAVFDYGPLDNPKTGFQVVYSSRMTNSAGGTKEVYFSNGGTLDLAKNTISPNGGMTEREAREMGMKANLLPEIKLKDVQVETSANTGGDALTSGHMRNWMECVRSRQDPHAPIEAGYSHAIAVIMANASYRTGAKATFDEKTQEVMTGGKVFQF